MNITHLSHAPTDLDNCDREPIHLPGSVQPHGVLIIINDAGDVTHASSNTADLFGIGHDELLGRPLSSALGVTLAALVESSSVGRKASLRGTIVVGPRGGVFHVLTHRAPAGRVVEFEAAGSAEQDTQGLYARVRWFAESLQGVGDLAVISRLVAAEVKAITGFDRVLVYRFDDDWNGTVIGEAKVDEWPSYMDLRFPASDIPKQARELYRVNRVRLIQTATYEPSVVAAVPGVDEKPLDLSFSVLRSVSPIHREYLRNMGVDASMSVSVMRGNKLWGLLACHHRQPLAVAFEARNACELIAQMFSLQFEAHEGHAEAEHRTELRGVLVGLLAAMAETDDFVEGLRRRENELLRYADARGAALVFNNQTVLLGETPSAQDVGKIVAFIAARSDEDVFATDRFAALWPEAAAFKARAAGVLAVSVSQIHDSYVLWFRPEVVRTAKWAGDPRKPVDPQAERLHPRKSFEQWKETLSNQSLPWKRAELDAVVELRNAIIGIVLRRAEELAELSAELERSNKELEAFSYSVSHDLRAPFRHISGFAEMIHETERDNMSERGRRYLATVIESAKYAGKLVDNLLHFSQMGRTGLTPGRLDMNQLVSEVLTSVKHEISPDRSVEWNLADLPPAWADGGMMRLAWQNLLSNALKYSRDRDPAVITVGARRDAVETIYFVSDNGAGFDMRYIDKLFGVFQRLHRLEEFEGTGIGLANVRRIVGRHGGRTWAEGEVGRGATFYFSLPKRVEAI